MAHSNHHKKQFHTFTLLPIFTCYIFLKVNEAYQLKGAKMILLEGKKFCHFFVQELLISQTDIAFREWGSHALKTWLAT